MLAALRGQAIRAYALGGGNGVRQKRTPPRALPWHRSCAPPVCAPKAYVGNGKMAISSKYADKRGAAIAVIEGGDERAAWRGDLKDLALGAELAKSVESRAEMGWPTARRRKASSAPTWWRNQGDAEGLPKGKPLMARLSLLRHAGPAGAQCPGRGAA